MDETSITSGNNPNDDSATGATTDDSASKQTETDNQTGDTTNNLDPSKSADASADDDKSGDSATDDKSGADDKSASDNKDGAPASKFDDDLGDWVEKRNLPKPENDEQRAEYQKLRDEQREFTRERQAKKDAEGLSKAVNEAKDKLRDPESDDDDYDDLDPLERRVKENEDAFAAERNLRLQNEFYSENKVTSEQHSTILAIMQEKFDLPATREGKLRALETWSSVDALPDLLDLAKARLASVDREGIADEAARNERERIERESNAKSPGRNASQHQSSDKTEDEARLERFKARYNKS